MTQAHSDIDTMKREIETLDLMVKDPLIEKDAREYSLTNFVSRNADLLLAFLDELKFLRDQINGGIPIGGFQKSHRVILEGYSDKSAEEALSNALDKAAHYFSEDHDISITIQQLIELPNGGHRAVLEVHITPLPIRAAPHVKAQDITLKRDHEKAFHTTRENEDETFHHLVFDHFSALTKAKTMGHIPSSFLINVTDAKLMSYMLEKQFLKAELSLKTAYELAESPSVKVPHQIKVHVRECI